MVGSFIFDNDRENITIDSVSLQFSEETSVYSLDVVSHRVTGCGY